MLDEKEFFIRKAIGWVLRDTARRRPEMVAEWLQPRAALAAGLTVREAVKHMPLMHSQLRWLTTLGPDEMMNAAKDLRAPYDLVRDVAAAGKLPVVNFAAGGIATPADAALMMELGCDGVFVGSGIFKSGDPAVRAAAIVEATTFHHDPAKIAKVSRNLGEAMVGINIDTLPESELMQLRGS